VSRQTKRDAEREVLRREYVLWKKEQRTVLYAKEPELMTMLDNEFRSACLFNAEGVIAAVIGNPRIPHLDEDTRYQLLAYLGERVAALNEAAGCPGLDDRVDGTAAPDPGRDIFLVLRAFVCDEES
jgi:hypothetical protein